MPGGEGFPLKDIEVPEDAPKELLLEKHAAFIKAYSADKSGYEFVITEYLRMSGMYWGLTSMALMKRLDEMEREEVLEFVKGCQKAESGGFGASPRQDEHILYTLSAVQILVLYDALPIVDCDAVVKYIVSLQQEDGSFFGDKWGEVDTRFSFCAVACLRLLGRLDDCIDRARCVDFVLSCEASDGGFGTRPESESHSGQVYCCVGTLALLGALHRLDVDRLAFWLCERQLPSGGLNGRPEKLPDVCYSWWVLASLAMLDRLHWINKSKLIAFILASQDEETGGISDRPGDIPDPFHTLFGLAGLCLLNACPDRLKPVSPIFCMPLDVLQHLPSHTPRTD